jgi:hypothetical protein
MVSVATAALKREVLTSNKVTSKPLQVVTPDPGQEGEQRTAVQDKVMPARERVPNPFNAVRFLFHIGISRLAREDGLATTNLLSQVVVPVVQFDAEAFGEGVSDVSGSHSESLVRA